jgi:mannosyltransferase
MEKIKNLIKNEYFLLGLIVLLAFVLRLINLSKEPFWGDEIFTLGVIKNYVGNWSGLIAYIKDIWIYPPLYFFILKFWTIIFGYSELAVRMISVLFGLGVVFITYFFSRRIFQSKEIALLSSFFVSILPIQIEFSQEARAYIILCFFSLLCLFSLYLYLNEKKYKWLFLFGLSSIFGLYTHYSFIIVLIAGYSWWGISIFLLEKNKQAKELIILLSAGLFTFIIFYDWIVVLIYNYLLIAKNEFFGIKGAVNIGKPYYVLESIIDNLVWATREKNIPKYEIIATGIFKSLFIFTIIFSYFKLKTKNIINKKAIIYFYYIFSFVLLLFILFPQSVHYVPLFEKHIIVNSVIAVIIFAFLLTRLQLKPKIILISLFMISLLNFNVRVLSNNSLWDPYFQVKNITEYINQYYQEGDIVVSYGSISRTIYNFYLDDKISTIGFFPPLPLENDWYAGRYTLGFLENQSHYRIKELSKEQEAEKLNYLIKKYQPNRIWLIDLPANSHIPEQLDKKHYRYAIKAIGKNFPVDLFSL